MKRLFKLHKTFTEELTAPKPFSCSLCTSFWLVLGYLILQQDIALQPIILFSIALMNSYANKIYLILIDIIYDTTFKVLYYIYNKLN
jgi:hypothetical protein